MALTLCAGPCGRMIVTNKRSRPPGEAMCHACRRARADARTCKHCGGPLKSYSKHLASAVYCSADCCTAAQTQPCPHARAGEVPQRCAPCTALVRQKRDRVKNVRRRGAAIPGVPTMSLAELGARDGWRCHLCRRRVDRALKSPDPMSASADHLIPVTFDGKDHPENLALAHRVCNNRRGTGGVVQLLLVG